MAAQRIEIVIIYNGDLALGQEDHARHYAPLIAPRLQSIEDRAAVRLAAWRTSQETAA